MGECHVCLPLMPIMIMPSFRIACKNALLLLLCAALNSHAFAQGAQDAQRGEKPLQLLAQNTQSGEAQVPMFDDSVQAANALIVNHEFAAAEEFIRAQMQRDDIPESDYGVLYYLLALALVGQEKYKGAEDILRNILVTTPTATHVRLSLGRVLFKQGNDVAAERQLDLVLADKEVPSYVHQQAHAYLEQIRTRNGWAFSGSFGIKRDDNIDNVTKDPHNPYAFLGLTIQPDSKKAGYVGSWSASGAFRRQVGGRTQMEGRLATYGNISQGDWDESTGFQISAGPRFFFPRGVLALSAVGSQHFAPDPIARSFGVLLFYQHALPGGLRPYLTAQYLNQNHLNDDDLDAHFGYAQLGVHFGLDGVTSANVAVTHSRNVARNSRNSYTSWKYEIGAQRDFSFGLTFGLGANYTRSEYDSEAGATLPAEFAPQRQYTAFVLKRDFDLFCGFVPVDEYVPGGGAACGFAPKFSYSHTNRASNVKFNGRDYTDNIFGLEFTKTF